MGNKEDVTKLSWEVNGLLSQYVVIHDDVFKTSIHHIIPIPGIFKAIDFSAHFAKMESILTELDNSSYRIKSLSESLSDQDHVYLNLLSEYVCALIVTVSLLKVVVGALHAKSQSFINSNYDWKNYNGDLAQYERSVQDYLLIGGRLNEMFEKTLKN